MSNHYKEAIEIIESDQDWRGICIQLAKNNPSLLCKYANGKNAMFITEAKLFGKVAAIKLIRNRTGMGLKESKELIESMTDDFGS